MVEGVVMHHVASWCAGGVDPSWGEVFGDTVGGETDFPVALVDQSVMKWTHEHVSVAMEKYPLMAR